MTAFALRPQLLNYTAKGTVAEVWGNFLPLGFVYSKRTRLLLPGGMWIWLRKETFLMTRNWDLRRQCLLWKDGDMWGMCSQLSIGARGFLLLWILNVYCVPHCSILEREGDCRAGSVLLSLPSTRRMERGFSGSPGGCCRVRWSQCSEARALKTRVYFWEVLAAPASPASTHSLSSACIHANSSQVINVQEHRYYCFALHCFCFFAVVVLFLCLCLLWQHLILWLWVA